MIKSSFSSFIINKQRTLSLFAVYGGFLMFIIKKQRNKFGIMRKLPFLAVYNKQTTLSLLAVCRGLLPFIINKQ